jgi:hypothetical protein
MAASLWPSSGSGLLGVAAWFVSAIPNESPFLAFYYMAPGPGLLFQPHEIGTRSKRMPLVPAGQLLPVARCITGGRRRGLRFTRPRSRYLAGRRPAGSVDLREGSSRNPMTGGRLSRRRY